MIATTEHPIVQELQAKIATGMDCRYLPVGSRSKPALSSLSESQVEWVPMQGLSGIIAYEPSEYLITAYSGTKLSQLQTALSEFDQYLPFDPLFVPQGATLGGTIASGVSGPNRMLYGGLRDFVMEVALIDGLGHVVRGGGRVVKNAAGFDLPKLVVGSYGRLGILTDVTLKVLPAPNAFVTLTAAYPSMGDVLKNMQKLLGQPLPISALDVTPERILQVRLSGPAKCLPSVVDRVSGLLAGRAEVIYEDAMIWQRSSQFDVADHELLLRITIQPNRLVEMDAAIQRMKSARLHSFSCGGTIAWLMVDDRDQPGLEAFDRELIALKSSAVAIAGQTEGLLMLGNRDWCHAASRIQRALDPGRRFVTY